MKTTPEMRHAILHVCREYTQGHVMGSQSIILNAHDIASVLDDFTTLEAELAALRRVEAENLHMEREQHVLHDEHRWCIGDASNGVVGWGLTMPEALEMYDDAKKEQR